MKTNIISDAFRKLNITTLLILCTACAGKAFIQPSAQGLKNSETAIIATHTDHNEGWFTFVKKVVDNNGAEVVSFELTANFNNTVTVTPGEYEIYIDCDGSDPFFIIWQNSSETET